MVCNLPRRIQVGPYLLKSQGQAQYRDVRLFTMAIRVARIIAAGTSSSAVEEASSPIVMMCLGVNHLRWASSSSSSETASEKPKKKVTDRLSGVIAAVNDRKLPPELRGQRNSVRYFPYSLSSNEFSFRFRFL